MEGDRSSAGMFSPGQALTAWQLNRVGETASKGLTIHSAYTETIQGTFGTVFMGGPPSTDYLNVNYPFKVTVITSSNGNELHVYVSPGTANNRMVKIGNDYLDQKETPKLSFNTFSMTGKKIVALQITKGDPSFFPNKSEIVLRDDEESLTDSDTNGYLQIASITGEMADGKPKVILVNQFIFASQIVVRAKPGSGTAVWSFLSR